MTTAIVRLKADALPEGTYEIDARASSVRFTAKSLFGMMTVAGSVTIAEGGLTVANPPTASSVHVTISAGSFDSAHAKRDQDVRSDRFLGVSSYPRITFRSTGLAIHTDTAALSGELTVRGVAKPVTLTIDRADYADGTARVHASTTVDRYAFGVTAAKGMAGRQLAIDVEIVARRTGAKAQ